MTNISCSDVIELMNQAKIEGWRGHVTGSEKFKPKIKT